MDDAFQDLESGSLSRRAVLRRGAALSGALVWAVPVVQSVSPAALAATDGSPAVKARKSGRRPDTEVLADKLPQTGFPVAQALAAGTVLVAGGAALVARNRKDKPAEPGEAQEALDSGHGASDESELT